MKRNALVLSVVLVLAGTVLVQAKGQGQSQKVDASSLEFGMRHAAPGSQQFGRLAGQYWGVMAETKDFPRAYTFFKELTAESKTPDATLLAEDASATGAYVGWMYEHGLAKTAGDAEIEGLLKGATEQYKQALTLDPENFSALYGYAVFEGYRPDGKDHQKELLAKLDGMRTAKPYLPWGLVDQLERTGQPE